MVAFVSTLLTFSLLVSPAFATPFYKPALERRAATEGTLGTSCRYSMISGAAITLGATTYILGDTASSSVVANAALTGFAGAFKKNDGSMNTGATAYASGTGTYSTAFSDYNKLFTSVNGEGPVVQDPAFAVGGLVDPGVYAFSAATAIPGIKLSGDVSSVYVFKSVGAMNFAASTIIERGNVLATNIFWVSSAALNVGAGAQIPGIFLAVGAITVGASCIMDAIFQSSAAITIGASTTIKPPAFGALCPSSAGTTTTTTTTTTDTSSNSGPALLSTCGFSIISGAAITAGAGVTVSGNGASSSVVAAAALTGFTSGTFFNTDGTANTVAKFTASVAGSDAVRDFNSVFQTIYTTTATANDVVLSGTIAPGVYGFSAATTIPASLTLDAAGTATSVWIFKAVGAMTYSANTQVILKNGALASNVFWLSNGALGIGATSNVPGIFMAIGAITIGAGCTMQATLMSSAAITLGANVALSTPTFSGICAASGNTANTNPLAINRSSACAKEDAMLSTASTCFNTFNAAYSRATTGSGTFDAAFKAAAATYFSSDCASGVAGVNPL